MILCALAALAACQQADKQQATNETAKPQEAAPVKGADRSHAGKAAPDIAFKDMDGEEVTLADFQGKPVLVNLWASWCVPCVKELPTLDRLARARVAAGDLQILAVSQDMGPHASVVAFLQARRVTNLDAYQDAKMALSGALGAEVLPTSILYNAQGREVWRYVGDLDWTSPGAAKLLAEAGAAKPS